MEELRLDISGRFDSEAELRKMIALRRICYDSEPFYIPDKKGGMTQIGFRLTLYGTLPPGADDATPDSEEYLDVERDLKRLADALSATCGPLHMCGAATLDPATLSYSQERKMRPDVTVHIPVFDQENFGRPVDNKVTNTLHRAIRLIESAGVKKTKWQE
jgi:hypothetical protein